MAISRDKLVNITIFMRYAVEAGKITTVNDLMGFAETLQEVNAELAAIDKAAALTPPVPPS